MRSLLITLLALVSLGCPVDADSKLDTAPPQDSDPPQAPSMQAEFLLDASGYGTDRLGGIEVHANLATLELSGVAHRGLAYQHHDWQSAGYVLFDLLTVAQDGSNLAVTYLYGQDGQLPYAYTESFAHPLDWETSGGTVEWSETPTTVQPDIPELVARPAPLDVGIGIDGDELWLDGQSGEILLDGARYELLPFATVDCTDCPGGPWLEIHCLLTADEPATMTWRQAGQACFGIVYLFPNDPDYAQLSYGICLPDLQTPSGDFEVSWSGSLATARSRSASSGGPTVGRPPRPR